VLLVPSQEAAIVPATGVYSTNTAGTSSLEPPAVVGVAVAAGGGAAAAAFGTTF